MSSVVRSRRLSLSSAGDQCDPSGQDGIQVGEGVGQGVLRSAHSLQVATVAAGALIVQRLLPAFVLAVALVGVPALILAPAGLPRMRALEAELALVTGENTDLRRDIGKLRAEVRELRDNPAAVERIARDQLGLVRRSEVVFQFVK